MVKGRNKYLNWAVVPKEERYQYLVQLVESRGWQVTSKSENFVNFQKKIECQCPKGHTFAVLPYHAADPSRGCPICAGFHRTLKGLQKFAEDRGWNLLNKEYKGARHSYDFQCKKCQFIRTTRHHHIRDFSVCRRCEKIEAEKFKKRAQALKTTSKSILKKVG